jgi:quinol monooxygenase YgiN
MTIPIVAVLKAKPGQESELRQALLTLIPPVLQEPGCIQYTLHESLDHPGHFVFYEAWADQAAIDRHGQTTHFQAFVSKCDTLLCRASAENSSRDRTSVCSLPTAAAALRLKG